MSEIKFDKIATVSGEYPTTLNRTYLARKKWVPADPNKILSFMPGTVEQILVEEGDMVKEGDVLLIFRAMKMNNKILAPHDAVVSKVVATAGENLPKNAVMIELK